jgi:hypothetical protein
MQVLRLVSALDAPHKFYLGGGTALAIHFGHRYSEDLDWFSLTPLSDPMALAQNFRDAGIPFETKQIAPGTLHGHILGVRVSFLEYGYPSLTPASIWQETGAIIASLDDLACMKLAAIAQRGARKDFIDLYALFTCFRTLPELLKLYQQKYSTAEAIAPVLYGLNYFDDAETEPMPKMIWPVTWTAVKKTIRASLKQI